MCTHSHPFTLTLTLTLTPTLKLTLSLTLTLTRTHKNKKNQRLIRCRPEVMAGMKGVQKLRDAVDRHRMASLTAEQVERIRLLEEVFPPAPPQAVTKL